VRHPTERILRKIGVLCALCMLSMVFPLAAATSEPPLPLHGITREDFSLVENVWTVETEEAILGTSPTGPAEGPRTLVESLLFDKQGVLRERVTYGILRQPERTRRYTYSGGHLILEEEYLETDPQYVRTEYTHDPSGENTTVEWRDVAGSLMERALYERDEEGRLASVEAYDAADELEYTMAYSYEENEERADRYDADGELLSWSIKTYDEEGRLVMVRLYGPSTKSSPYTLTYTYDEQGSVTLETRSGQIALGPLVITPGEVKNAYAYVYDERGNWVERVQSVWTPTNGTPQWREVAISYRIITYHD
jgi:hypothetical protein